jgi:peptidoglycan-associated lipoprotein
MNFKIVATTALLGSTLFLGACGSGSTRDGGTAAPVIEGGTSAATGVEGGAAVSGAREGGAWSGRAFGAGSGAPLDTRLIYFEFDRSDIRPEYYEVLRAHAQKLIREPNTRMLVEGHADERGSREYNIALGERRANAVLSFLMAEGVASNQLSSVSFGEEQPLDLGHGEAAWSANRRAELIYE